MSGGARLPWWMPLATRAAAGLMLALGASWRIDRGRLVAYDREIAAGRRCIFALWHARMLPLVYSHRGRGVVVLVSHHRDGEWIARLIEHLGFRTARGSSTRGGEEGLRRMVRLSGEGRLLAITPDGPRGPAERVKPGLVYLASRTGLPIVPVAAAAGAAWVMRSWDRFRIPKPFARVVVAYGTPIEVPRAIDEAGAERVRREVEEAIAALTAEVQVAAREPVAGAPPAPGAGKDAPS